MRCQTPIWVDPGDEPLQVPCGKCLICLSNRRQDWSVRILNEYKYSIGSRFITLTYSDKHLPEDGQLNKSDLQKYFKRLRKTLDKRVRYYAVGEYGTKRGRPHYHILLFNVKDDDEQKIRNAWTLAGEPLGIVHIGSVTAASVVYCLKYVVQPEQKELAKSKDKRPFSTMSRGYGIGGMYLSDEVVDWHRIADANYLRIDGQVCRMPRFYKEKVWCHKTERDRINQKAKTQGEIAETLRYIALEEQGYTKAQILEMQRASLQRLKTKVAHGEKL